MKVDELRDLNIGQQFIDAWRDNGIDELTEVQASALKDASLRQGRNAVIVAPTSSGKTFIGEVLAVRAASTLHRAIYLAPYKALAEEKYLEFWERYRDLGISVVISSGDHSEFDAEIRRGNFGIAVIVYEKLAQLLVQSPGIVCDCHLVVVDEGQLIRERTRGPLLELLLTRIKRMNPSPQLVCLSATVQDLGGFDSWLGANVIVTKNRPVPLWEGVIEKAGSVALHNVADDRTEVRDFGLPTTAQGGNAILEALVRGLRPEEQMLVFRTKVDDTEQTAARLVQVVAVRPVQSSVRDRVGALEDTPLRAFLDKHIERGIAYHNGGLSMEERRLVESLFIEGVLQVIVTTATLAAGVNLPADIVVMRDFRRWDFDKKTRVPIDVAEYRNCVGRAGRYGKRSAGTSLLIAEMNGQTAILEREYIHAEPPRLESAIPQQPEFARHVLGVTAQQLGSTKPEIMGLFQDSFAFFNYYQPRGQEKEMILAVESGIKQLLDLSLIEEQEGKLLITPLGRVAALSGVYIETFAVLESLVRTPDLENLTDPAILSRITNVAEMKSLRPFSASERAELLSKWISGETIMDICNCYSKEYSVGHGRIRDLGESAEWLVLTCAQIATTLDLAEGTIQRLERLAQEAHFGVPIELVQIARLRILHRSDLLRLMFNNKGVKLTQPHQILDAEPKLFVGILAPQKVIALKDGIARSIGESLRRRRIGHLLRCDRLAAIRPLVERVYDAHGKEFERALEDLFNAPMVELGVRRFARQGHAEPDLELLASRGTVVISAAASEDDQKPVPWDKAREVLGSVGYSGKASNFVVIGKPDFHELAIQYALEVAGKNTTLLLVPVDVAVELCLQRVEGRLTREGLVSKLEDAHGIVKREDVEVST
jgi:helicase